MALLSEPLVLMANLSSTFPLVWMWTLSSDLLCMSLRLPNFNVERVLGVWWRAMSYSGWGREQLLSLCQTVKVIVPLCLPEENHISQSSQRKCQFKDSYSQTCLMKPLYLYVQVYRTSGINRATRVITANFCPLVCLFESFLWCFFNLPPL